MDVRPIRTEEDYRWALQEVEPYFESPPPVGSPEGDRFDVLSTLIEAYEDAHWPVPIASPIDLLNFAIEDMGRSQADLARILGSRSRASEILARKRPLTVNMIQKIGDEWGLPVDVLARPYEIIGPKPPGAKKTKRKKANRVARASAPQVGRSLKRRVG